MKSKVIKTKSGIFIRNDENFGLLAFSPFTGLFFAIHPSDELPVIKWLENPNSQPPRDDYLYNLGSGWAKSVELSQYPKPRLLPNNDIWTNIPKPQNPILINWLITGECPLACSYCYAEDLMRQPQNEPERSDVIQIAENILAQKPLAVVLSGGDPLVSPFLEDAITTLYNRSGIIVDTNGYMLTDDHIKLFKSHDVTVRISLDFERPKNNQAIRKFNPSNNRIGKNLSTAKAAFDAICKCLDSGLAVTVHTVATKTSVTDLISFGDKLYKLGIRSWRIFTVSDSKMKHTEFEKLSGKIKPYEYMSLKINQASRNNWHQNMDVQFLLRNSPDAVILVSPNGIFYNESITRTGKTIIDPKNPKNPQKIALDNWLGWESHVKRYLNISE